MIETILISELKEFYPITDSVSQGKIDTQMGFVKNVTFLQMFGLAISTKIFSGDIDDSASADFIGFRKFVALCIVGNLIEDSFVHTNAGLKIVSQNGWQSPKTNEKSNPLNKISNTIENQFVEAKKILMLLEEIPKNKYVGYGTFEVKII